MTDAALRQPASPPGHARSPALTAVGAFCLVLGLIGIAYAFAFTVASVVFYGALLVAGGIAQLYEPFFGRPRTGWRARIARATIGLIYIAAGLIAIFQPLRAALALTLLLGVMLLASGAARAVAALYHSGSRAGLVLAAFVSLVLGAALVVGWPVSSLWAIGLFVSCDLIAYGFALLWQRPANPS
jgi:uncharacterized membrane protein HdeD (DUF308 family)